MKSARINFGIGAESEYVLEVDDTGVATKCFNPVTGQELGGGGESGLVEIEYDGANTYTFKITPNQVADLIDAGVMPWCNNIPAELLSLLELPDDSIIILPNVNLGESECMYVAVVFFEDTLLGNIAASDNDSYLTLVVD